MLTKIRKYITEYGLFEKNTRVLVAVSGGADSIAMLHVLSRLGQKLKLELVAAHLNHGMRGRESDADAAFVEQTAAEIGLQFIKEKKNVPQQARAAGISFEMAARAARYSFFERASKKMNCNTTATAHTMDDQAETVILNLARGSGLQGLGGIPRDITRNNIRIVRPLLGISRAEIIAWLQRHKLTWREDASNKDLTYLRNRVRHEIIPTLEKHLNPSIKQTLARSAEVLAEENDWLDAESALLLDKCMNSSNDAVECRKLAGMTIAGRRRVIRRACTQAGVPPEWLNFDAIGRISALAGSESGSARVNIAANWSACREYDLLRIIEDPDACVEQAYAFKLKKEGETVNLEAGLKAVCEVRPGLIKDSCCCAGTLPASASLNIKGLGRKRLVLRSAMPGDRIRPLGIKGTKKIKNILVDEKVPRAVRGGVPVLEYAGEIIWLPGYRVARGWDVTDPSEPALHITVSRMTTSGLDSVVRVV